MSKLPKHYKDINGVIVKAGDKIRAHDIADGCVSTGYPFEGVAKLIDGRLMFVRDSHEYDMGKVMNRQKGEIITDEKPVEKERPHTKMIDDKGNIHIWYK